jgi:hypothetical protein
MGRSSIDSKSSGKSSCWRSPGLTSLAYFVNSHWKLKLVTKFDLGREFEVADYTWRCNCRPAFGIGMCVSLHY